MRARLPLFVDLSGRRVLVVGGGRAAERKLPALIAAGALVTLIALRIREGVRRLLCESHGELLQRRARVQDVSAKYMLFFALTDNSRLNRRLRAAARAAKVWVAGSTDPKGGDFHFGAVVDRGLVRLAISTGGRSPTLARLAAEVLRHLLPETLASDATALRRQQRRLREVLAALVRGKVLLTPDTESG